MNKPLVSVIITTRNSAKTIKELLTSIKSQSYKNIEIILVDNNSSDQTVNFTKEYTNKVFNKGPERSVQRNWGALKSKGKYLLFLDSDMVLTKNVVAECVEVMEVHDKEGVGGLIIPEKSFGSGFWVKAKILERKIHEGREYFEAARFFPKKIFEKFGGYDEKLTGPEDWELPERISHEFKINRIKNYIKHNEGQHTLIELAKKKYYYGLSAHKYLQKHNKSLINPRTVYFLRVGFYKNWRTVFSDPLLYLGMWLMLFAETIGGGLGYLKGRFTNDK